MRPWLFLRAGSDGLGARRWGSRVGAEGVDDDHGTPGVVADAVGDVPEKELSPARHSGVADDQNVDRGLFGSADDREGRIVVHNDLGASPVSCDRAGVPREIVGCGLDPLGRSALRVGGMVGNDHLNHV